MDPLDCDSLLRIPVLLHSLFRDPLRWRLAQGQISICFSLWIAIAIAEGLPFLLPGSLGSLAPSEPSDKQMEIWRIFNIKDKVKLRKEG
jgi:hypothetical protein